ncbi:YwiC-like family protein [Bacillus piscicola]|uniref:YwiC-like family protein n=1 Tax=Bacillus piscicola TaxID=1632684 RepID=UPI001F0955BB|nr:YwiC-like family protein [Bacillus piscicola]
MKKLLLPKQHGAWVMVFLPFLIGVIVGRPDWIHILLFLGWLLLYISSYPLLNAVKNKKKRSIYIKWFASYTGLALLFLLVPVLLQPKLLLVGVVLLPVLAVNLSYAKRKNERALLNDLAAIIGLCAGGPAAYYAGTGAWDETALYIWAASVLFFIGSVFFVKMFIREKKNATFKWYSWAYHGFVFISSFVFGFITLGIAYSFSFLRSFVFYKRPLRPKQTALIEAVNSVYFLIVMVIWLA